MSYNSDFYLKKGDTSPALEVQLLDNDDDPVDMSNGTAKFRMKEVGSDTFVVDSMATPIDDSTGKIAYEWSSGDTDSVGSYLAEFLVDYSGGVGDDFDSDETFPNSRFLSIEIEDGL